MSNPNSQQPRSTLHCSTTAHSQTKGPCQDYADFHCRSPSKAAEVIAKLHNPKSVMIVAKAFDSRIVYLTSLLACNLIDIQNRVCPGSDFHVYVDHKLRDNGSFCCNKLLDKRKDCFKQILFWTSEFIASMKENEIDVVITLGGDGTVLYTSWLFQKTQVPPVIPFHLGSLGFLTNFDIGEIRPVMEFLFANQNDCGIRVNMRTRFECSVWRSTPVHDNNHYDPKGLAPSCLPACNSEEDLLNFNSPFDMDNRLDGAISALAKATLNSPRVPQSGHDVFFDRISASVTHTIVETFHILNDLVVDRGPSPFMGQLELFVDDRHLTTVQADGLVIATPTGSTAYSLSAGGSLAHPGAPCILVTPICPHTLSFRPMLLPDSIELRIQVPMDSRSRAWASFDGRHRTELSHGDFITITRSSFSMPTICAEDPSVGWFKSLSRCLHWNERVRQKGNHDISPHAP